MLNFLIELHSIFDKIGKLSFPIDSKKFLQTLRNCPTLHEIRQIFQKWGISFHNNKNFGKTKIFQGGSLTLSRFILTGFLNFEMRILLWNSKKKRFFKKILRNFKIENCIKPWSQRKIVELWERSFALLTTNKNTELIEAEIEHNTVFVYECAACFGANREYLPSADRQLLLLDSSFPSSRKNR